MKQVMIGMLMVLVLGVPINSAAQVAPKSVTFHSGATSTADGTSVEVGLYNSVGVDVEITDTATVTFEILAKSGGTWRSMACVSAGDTTNTLITTLSSSGSVQCNIAGMAAFRVRVSAYTGGTVSASGRATTAVLARKGGGGSGAASSITGSTTLPAEPCTINQIYAEEVLGVATLYFCTDGTWQEVGSAEADTLDSVFDRGKTIDSANSFANSVRILDANGDGIAIYTDATDGSKIVCVDNHVENACTSYTRELASGQTVIYKNSGGTDIFTLTESTGALTNVTLDASATGNTVTSRFYWDLDLCGVSPADGTTTGHIWNRDPLSTAPSLTADVDTNVGRCYATFPDTDTTYGVQITRHLPDGFVAGSLSADIWWNTTGTGNARFQIQTKCYADDEADDASFNTATVTTAAAGTSGRPNKQNVASIDTTGCVGGEMIRMRFFRVRTEASDTLNAALNVEKVFFKGWDAQ